MSAITFGLIRNGIKYKNINFYKKITQRLPIPGPPAVLSAKYSTIHPESKVNFLPTNLPLYETSRHKGTSKIRKFKSKDEPKSESQSEEEELEDDTGDKNSRLIKVNVATLRADAIIKNSLGIARNKIDTLFYDNKIRLNGEKLSKKNTTVKEGDEVDIIKGFSQDNPEFLVIARVEILEILALDNAIAVKARRYKTLTVENYEKDKYDQ